MGVRRAHEDGTVALWFRPVGYAGAGIFEAEDVEALAVCGFMTIPEALPAGALVKLALPVQDEEDRAGPLKANDVTRLREDDGTDRPYRVFHRGVEHWYLAESLTLASETSQHSPPEQGDATRSLQSLVQVDAEMNQLLLECRFFFLFNIVLVTDACRLLGEIWYTTTFCN